jgi:hypothetical protein
VRGLPQSIEIALRGTIVYDYGLAFNVAKVSQTLPEVIPDRCIIDNANVGDPYDRLLSAHRERCYDDCATEKRDEIAPLHWMYSLRLPGCFPP